MPAKCLLDNARAPLTFSWGFIEASLETVTKAYRRWQRTILHSVNISPVDLRLADALHLLEPLDNGSQRVLFVRTQGNWTACFDNGAAGGNPPTFAGELSQRLKCRGIACSGIPNTLTRRDGRARGTWGAVKFTLFGPDPRKALNIERSVSVANDVRGWEFTAIGAVQDFEQVERYAAATGAERVVRSDC